MSKVLTPRTQSEDLELLKNDDKNFTETKKYVEPLILGIMDKYAIDSKDRDEVILKIFDIIPKVIGHYLEHVNRRESYRFSTYFIWWAKQTVQNFIKEKDK